MYPLLQKLESDRALYVSRGGVFNVRSGMGARATAAFSRAHRPAPLVWWPYCVRPGTLTSSRWDLSMLLEPLCTRFHVSVAQLPGSWHTSPPFREPTGSTPWSWHRIPKIRRSEVHTKVLSIFVFAFRSTFIPHKSKTGQACPDTDSDTGRG